MSVYVIVIVVVMVTTSNSVVYGAKLIVVCSERVKGGRMIVQGG